MKRFKTCEVVALAAAICVLAVMLAGCASITGQGDEEAEQANANRQYMAQLNSEMADMQQVMDDFQVAVSEHNTVAMKAQIQKADRIIADIEASEATESLVDAKDLYVDALTTLNDAMKDYADLYMQVEVNGIDSDDLSERMDEVQAAYDEGVEKLQEADEAVSKLAQG